MQKDFNSLMNTFKSSIKTWDYFVNWSKVLLNSSELEIILNKLNFLLGKENLEEEFTRLYKSNPDIVKALPILLAVREKKIEIFDKVAKTYESFNFSSPEIDSNKYYKFINNSGLYKLFKSDGVKNLVDYVMGVEVGLDTNARKNRGGNLMEKIVEVYIRDFCKYKGLDYLVQARATQIKNKWNVDIRVNKSERNFDFAIYNPKNNKIKLIETNFYNGGGSKLKSVCGEFKNLHDELKAQCIDLLWVTDGHGWNTAKKPLEEVYENNDYVFNLDMLENNILHKLEW